MAQRGWSMDGARCGNVAVLELSSTAVHVWKTDVDCFPRKKCPDDHWQKFRFGSVSRWWEVVRTNQSKVTKTICSEAMKRIGIILVGVVLGGQSNTQHIWLRVIPQAGDPDRSIRLDHRGPIHTWILMQPHISDMYVTISARFFLLIRSWFINSTNYRVHLPETLEFT